MAVPSPERFLDKLRDYLSESTRRVRRALLASCVASLLYTIVDIVPSRVVALGLEFDRIDQVRLSQCLMALVFYLGAEFSCFARRDYMYLLTLDKDKRRNISTDDSLAWNFKVWNPRVPVLPREGILSENHRTMIPWPFYGVQAFVDFYFPLLFGAWAIIALWLWEPNAAPVSPLLPE
jgi:hypothetical protein